MRPMCEDIREELAHAEYLDQYRISQIKEKYGTLCWYDFGCTERMLRDIIPKYEHLSARTCIRCGNPATKVSTGWISPYCDTCAGKISHAERFISIGEWLDRSSSEVTSKRNLNEKACPCIFRRKHITAGIRGCQNEKTAATIRNGTHRANTARRKTG